MGCGTGYYSYKIQKLISDKIYFIGFDINSVFDERFVSNNYFFVQGDIFKVPFKSNSFDAIVSFDVIEHIENDKKFIEIIIDLLKPGGIFICGTPNADRLPIKIYEFFKGKRKFPVIYGTDPVLGLTCHIREYTKKSANALLSSFSNEIFYEIKPFLFGLRLASYIIGIANPNNILSDFSYYWLLIGEKK